MTNYVVCIYFEMHSCELDTISSLNMFLRRQNEPFDKFSNFLLYWLYWNTSVEICIGGAKVDIRPMIKWDSMQVRVLYNHANCENTGGSGVSILGDNR